jgi:hypothetical protein
MNEALSVNNLSLTLSKSGMNTGMNGEVERASRASILRFQACFTLYLTESFIQPKNLTDLFIP